MIHKSLITHVLWILVLPTTGVQAAGTETLDNTLLGSGAGTNLTTGQADNGIDNTFIGFNAGNAVTIGDGNTFVGDVAGQNNTANANAFFGAGAGATNTTGTANTFVGWGAGGFNLTGANNTFLGTGAGFLNSSGDANTAVGDSAGGLLTTGSENTFVGKGAGVNSNGSNNVFLGANAGGNETGSNKLYIEASSSADPLIYGEFNNNIVGINGILGVGTQLPTSTLHVKRSDDTARLLVEETGGGGNQALLQLTKTASAPFQRYTSAYGTWDFSAGNFFVINDPADAAIEFLIDKAGNLTVSGTLNSGSSRTVKQDFAAIDPREILTRVMALPITQWSYKADRQVHHLGPVAEDFAAAFGLGASDKTISVLDSGGVALAAIQGLKTEKDAELKALKKEMDRDIAALENALQQKDAAFKQLKAENDAQVAELKADLSELKRFVTTLAAQGQVVAVTGSQ